MLITVYTRKRINHRKKVKIVLFVAVIFLQVYLSPNLLQVMLTGTLPFSTGGAQIELERAPEAVQDRHAAPSYSLHLGPHGHTQVHWRPHTARAGARGGGQEGTETWAGWSEEEGRGWGQDPLGGAHLFLFLLLLDVTWWRCCCRECSWCGKS